MLQRPNVEGRATASARVTFDAIILAQPFMKHWLADYRGANWLCARGKPGDVLTTDTGDDQVVKLHCGVGPNKTEGHAPPGRNHRAVGQEWGLPGMTGGDRDGSLDGSGGSWKVPSSHRFSLAQSPGEP